MVMQIKHLVLLLLLLLLFRHQRQESASNVMNNIGIIVTVTIINIRQYAS